MADMFDQIVSEEPVKGKRDVFDRVGEISTITGKPVPTPQESWEQQARVIGTVLPIAGDIAGGLLAPQIRGPMMLGRLVNLGSKALGAGLGGGLGSALGTTIEKGEPDWEEAYKQGLIGTGSELGLGMLGAGAKVVEKPILGLLANITVSGRNSLQYFSKRLKEVTQARAARFLDDIAPESVKEAGTDLPSILSRISAAKDETRLIYGSYKEMLEQAGQKEGGKILLDDTSQFFGNMQTAAEETLTKLKGKPPTPAAIDNEVLRNLNMKPNSNQGRLVRQIMADEAVSPANVEYLLATVFKRGKQEFADMTPEMRTISEKMKDAVMSDIDRAGRMAGIDVAAKKATADQTWKAIMQYQEISRIFERGISKNPDTGRMVFHPATLSDAILASKSQIEKTMPDLWPRLEIEAKAYANVAEKLGDAVDLQANALMSGFGGLAGYGVFGLKGIPVAESFGAISAWALMNDTAKKLLRNFIEYGTKVPVKTGLHMQARPVNIPVTTPSLDGFQTEEYPLN